MGPLPMSSILTVPLMPSCMAPHPGSVRFPLYNSGWENRKEEFLELVNTTTPTHHMHIHNRSQNIAICSAVAVGKQTPN